MPMFSDHVFARKEKAKAKTVPVEELVSVKLGAGKPTGLRPARTPRAVGFAFGFCFSALRVKTGSAHIGRITV